MENDKPRFSIIVPVYNRPGEVEELLGSLARQTYKNFEVVITEDGSTIPCEPVVDKYRAAIDITYLTQPNNGRSPARNNSMEHSRGEYFIFFDSDCIIPDDYFEKLTRILDENPVDCYGGRDTAHESFTTVQKAIDFAMTSFLTTGGIRGGKRQLEKFTPRTFNMGFSREVYEKVGGFREMFSEDIDMSKRIEAAGFKTVLLREVPVYHKRRVSLKKFFKQVHTFGRSRITLERLYPGSLKIVHALPAVALVVALAMTVLAVAVSPWFLLPFGLYAAALFLVAMVQGKGPAVSALSILAAAIQIAGYGSGFIRAWFNRSILRNKRNIDDEIKARKGK